MPHTAESSSLFEIDRELDELLDEVQEEVDRGGKPAQEQIDRFRQFCEARGEKVDRIGRFVRMMEAHAQYCRSEAARLADRARTAERKVERTKSMVLFYLMSRELRKIEGQEFTLRSQKNGQDSVRITDESAVPIAYRRVEARMDGVFWETLISHLPEELEKALKGAVYATEPDFEAIKLAAARQEPVPGAEVYRGNHLRVA